VSTQALPRLLIAGVSSGVGKTTLTLGLCRALRRRGLQVSVFKCGPDYLDPTYHRLASGREVHNLDSWLMDHDSLRESFCRAASDCDLALIEGVMGLFDGASPTDLAGSSAEIAQIILAPIVLACDASGMARSLAALAHGFDSFEAGVRVSALLCNRLGSQGHLELVRRASARIPVLGGLLDAPELALPERHLGLHTAHELDIEPLLEGWADRVEAQCDLPALLALARSAPPLPAASAARASAPTGPSCRIGLAYDQAFHFYYEANLHLLERAGAELVRFSPCADPELACDLDGLYLGGGYPELVAAALAANTGMRAALRAHAAAGKPIYAECGGLMYLADAIITRDGQRHPMLGLIPGSVVMHDKLQALGYVEVETHDASVLGPAGTRFRGHEFRYSSFDAQAAGRYNLRSVRTGLNRPEGYGTGSVLGSYVHAHWASNPSIPEAFVRACATSRGPRRAYVLH